MDVAQRKQKHSDVEQEADSSKDEGEAQASCKRRRRRLTSKSHHGAYHFTPLQIAGRNNSEALTTWIERVLSLHVNITKYGRGWENLGSTHSVQKLYEWLGKDEKNVIMTEFNRLEDEARHYSSDTELIKGETIEKLVAFLRGISPNKFGNAPFKRSWCADA